MQTRKRRRSEGTNDESLAEHLGESGLGQAAEDEGSFGTEEFEEERLDRKVVVEGGADLLGERLCERKGEREVEGHGKSERIHQDIELATPLGDGRCLIPSDNEVLGLRQERG